jgi:hypothetical protein
LAVLDDNLFLESRERGDTTMRDILHVCDHPLRDDHDVVPVFQPSLELLEQIEFDRLKG